MATIDQKALFNKFDSFDSIFLKIAEELLATKPGIYNSDLFFIGIINRSLSLLNGFKTLIRSKNYIGAVHLVRPHLDSFLRLFAMGLVDDTQRFCKKIMDGEQIRKLHDRNNKLMTDSYLCKIATRYYPWIQEVYSKTSGFIHFSESHIFSSGKVTNDSEKHIELGVSKTDLYVNEEDRLEALLCMIEITDNIIFLLNEWLKGKKEWYILRV